MLKFKLTRWTRALAIIGVVVLVVTGAASHAFRVKPPKPPKFWLDRVTIGVQEGENLPSENSIATVIGTVVRLGENSHAISAAGNLIYNPEGTTIEVVQGQTFLIRHTLEWNEPENGAYAITLYWDCYDNHENENFTFVGASAYFTTGAYAGQSILAEVSWLVVASPDYPGSTRYILSVKCPANKKDPRNGEFNVDITLSAAGVGEVPHIATDNHPIPFHFGGVIIIEGGLKYWHRDSIIIKVLEPLI